MTEEHDDKGVEPERTVVTAEAVSLQPGENALYIHRDDYRAWILILVVCAVIFISFFGPFKWMLNQWFKVEVYSPGPLVPILILLILWFQLRKTEYRPTYSRRGVYAVAGVAVALGALVYMGKEVRSLRDSLEGTSEIVFGFLFYAMTIMLFYAAYLFAREEKLNPAELEKGEANRIALGMTALVLGLLLHFLGMRGDLNRISIMAYIGLMFGLTWFIFGRGVAKKMLFPYAFLLFIVPMDFLDDFIGGPLRMFATGISVGIMKTIGPLLNMEIVRLGTTFTINGERFDVAPACSGLRSLVALSSIGAAYAFITQPTIVRKWLLGLCAIPIALLTNIIRLLAVGFSCHFFGARTAGAVHDKSLPLYIVAIIFLFSLDKTFDRVAKAKWFKACLEWVRTRTKDL